MIPGRRSAESGLICPTCSQALISSRSSLRCPSCEIDYAISDGYVDMIDAVTPYWGEIPQADMRDLLSVARDQGVRIALARLANMRPDLSSYLLSHARADWIFHWIPHSGGYRRCAELGSGWGTTTLNLSRFFDQVVSIEIVPERVAFQALRTFQEGITNVVHVRASALDPPLADGTYDLVVANGLLEWVPLSRPQDGVKKTQLEFLRTCSRKLADGGCLFVGIENRIGAGYFVGAPDHSGYPFTSLLPRRVASLFVRYADRFFRLPPESKRTEVARQKYLTWTYSIPGYARLLSSAGFSQVQVFWCYPSYNLPRFSGRFDDANSLREFSAWILRRGGQDLPVYKRVLATILALSPEAFTQALSWLFWPNVFLLAFKNRVPDSPASLLPFRSGVRMGGADRMDGSVSFLQLSKGQISRFLRISRVPTEKGEPDDGSVAIGSRFLSIRRENIQRGRAFRKHSVNDNRSLLRWLSEFQTRSPMLNANSAFLEGELNGLFDTIEYRSISP